MDPLSVESLAIVLHHSRSTGTAKVVALGIANHDGDGGAWPTIATLARYANVSPRSVQKAVAQLVALGEIVVNAHAGGTVDWDNSRRPNLYEIRISCPTDCDRSKHHRTRRSGTTMPLPLTQTWGVEIDTPPLRDVEIDTPRPVEIDTPRGVENVTQTIHSNHPENAGACAGASTTEAPPASESLATIRSILSRRTS